MPVGTRGKARVDDRRGIGGLVHVLESGGRWADAPSVCGPRKTLCNRFVRWADKGARTRPLHAPAQSGGPPAQVPVDSSAAKAHRSAAGGRGETRQAIGCSRRGRTAEIHALTDAKCRPLAVLLPGGNEADCAAGAALLEQLPATSCRPARAAIPTRSARRPRRDAQHPAQGRPGWKSRFSPVFHRNRNAIERMFCRLKDFRRSATRYDRSAVNFLAAVSIAATVCFW